MRDKSPVFDTVGAVYPLPGEVTIFEANRLEGTNSGVAATVKLWFELIASTSHSASRGGSLRQTEALAYHHRISKIPRPRTEWKEIAVPQVRQKNYNWRNRGFNLPPSSPDANGRYPGDKGILARLLHYLATCRVQEGWS